MRKLLFAFALFAALACNGRQVITVKKNNVQSLLEAIAQANKQNADPKSAKRLYILIPNGYYDLGETVLTAVSGHNITLIGQSTDSCVIRNCPDFKNEGISKTAIFLNLGTGNCYQDMTLRNDLDYYSCGAAGRGVTIQDKGNHTIMNRVRLLSYQDTYYSWAEDVQHYIQDSEIHGTVDFICGAGDVWFERCRLVTEKRTVNGKGRNVIAAPRTSKTQWGFVFNHCTIENIESSFDYARGWHTHPRCAFLYTTLLSPDKLTKTRYDRMGMRTVQNDFKEYATMDAQGNDITPKSNVVTFELKEERNPVETILTPEEAARYTLDNVYTEWKPLKTLKTIERKARKLRKKF